MLNAILNQNGRQLEQVDNRLQIPLPRNSPVTCSQGTHYVYQDL